MIPCQTVEIHILHICIFWDSWDTPLFLTLSIALSFWFVCPSGFWFWFFALEFDFDFCQPFCTGQAYNQLDQFNFQTGPAQLSLAICSLVKNKKRPLRSSSEGRNMAWMREFREEKPVWLKLTGRRQKPHITTVVRRRASLNTQYTKTLSG